MTRQEHLDWCKARALKYVEAGDLTNAYTSMVSDLRGHDETKDHPAIELGMMLLIAGHLSTPAQMIEFIQGFN